MWCYMKKSDVAPLLQHSTVDDIEAHEDLNKDIRSMQSKHAKSLSDSFADNLTSFICGKTHKNEDDDKKSVIIKIDEHQVNPSVEKMCC